MFWAFLPPLLPAFIELYQKRIPIEPMTMQIAAVSSGLVDELDAASANRARQTVTRLVRSAEFGQKVVTAYGKKCAMCGINLGLVSGAHILPVSSVSSVDEVWNGIALCENHHRAFDSHRLWVEPGNRALKIHPDILEHASSNEYSKAFVNATFRERYRYFNDVYDWAS
jgi:predicted restriction endonuclease